MSRRLRTGGLAGLLVVLLATPSAAAVRHILLLQSLDRGNITLDAFTGDFRIEVERRSSEPVTFTQFVVNPTGFAVSPERPVVDFLRAAFADRAKPDLVMTLGGPAATFARKYRQQLFPESPLLFAAVDRRFLEGAPLAANEAAVPVDNDFSLIVEDILQLFPGTSTVFMVTGSGPIGRFWHERLERDFRRFPGVRFVWSDELSLDQIVQRASALPPRSAIFFLTFGTDAQGGSFPEERVLAELDAAANAPLFAAQSPHLGHGILGGRLMSVDQLARSTADVALRLLDAEPAGAIRLPVQGAGPAVFDARQLRRWKVDESRLPRGSSVRFREPGIWERFRWVILAGASVLVAQAALIGALLVSRAKRRRAAAELEAARAALSSLSRRLMEAQEDERKRVARELHDDVSQRMSFLTMDVARLREGLPEAASEARSEMGGLYDGLLALGKDIQRISHRLHTSKVQYLGLPAAAKSLCGEIAARQPMAVDYQESGFPSAIPEGAALSLFRMLQEALSNAVKHSGARRCTVSLHGTPDAVTLDVVDDGRGFDLGVAIRHHGLGLVSMQERLKLVGGDVVIESKVGGGTAVRARVPLPAPAP